MNNVFHSNPFFCHPRVFLSGNHVFLSCSNASIGHPCNFRREARKLGLLLSGKSSEAERELLEPLERNERVCGECPHTNAHYDCRMVRVMMPVSGKRCSPSLIPKCFFVSRKARNVISGRNQRNTRLLQY